MNDIFNKLDWGKMNNLIPVIIQDANTSEVLMQAYVNQEALRLTIETGNCHYFSRSKNRIWMKGESSGNIQKVKEIYVDCDGDCLLFKVNQIGVACHTGNKSCFFEKIYGD